MCAPGGDDLPPAALAWLEARQWQFSRSDDGRGHLVSNPAQELVGIVSGQGFTLGPANALGADWRTGIMVSHLSRENGPVQAWQARETCYQNNELWTKGDGWDVQYINSAEGLRQNFIVHQRPMGSGALMLTLHTDGGSSPKVASPTAIDLVDATGHRLFSYRDLKVWDACGNVLPARMGTDPTCEQGFRIIVDDQGAHYPILIDPVSNTQNVLLSGSISSGWFGASVSTAGDLNGDGYSDIVVSASQAGNGQALEGILYVYHGGPTGISTTPTIVIESNMTGIQLGYSVANAGDVNGDGFGDIIAGATTYANGQSNEGACFVFLGSVAGVSSTPSTILQSNAVNHYMGYSVASAGDINNDGFSDIICGAWLAPIPGTNGGAAYIFLGNASGISTTPVHRLSRDQSGAQFGAAVSGAGDVNGDGFSDIVVGAYRYDFGTASGTDNGVAYIYHGAPGGLAGGGFNPAPTTTLGPTSAAGANFGWSVSHAGDVNGDGYSDIVASAYRHNIGGPLEEGVVYIFHGSATGVNTTPASILESNFANAWFGRSVSTAGDVNGDGYADIVVGAVTYTNGQNLEGAGFLYLGSPSGVPVAPFITYQFNIAGANMGESVRTAGDVNGDGYSDLIIGMRLYSGTGGALIYHGGTYNLNPTATIVRYGGQLNGYLGCSVANAGDLNGDGYSDVAVGEYGASNGQAGEGRVHVHYGSTGGIAAIPSLTLEANVAGAQFGYSVASAGDVNGDGYADLVVGAPLSGGTGRAYLYLGAAAGLSSTPALTWTGTAGSEFGFAVSTAGDTNADGYAEVLVGAPVTGQVFVYNGALGQLPATALITLTSPSAGARFGAAVATAGDVNGDGRSDVIIGAPQFSNGQAGEGAVFVYHGAPGQLNPAIQQQLERNQAGARFGVSVCGAGDINGDGFFDIAAGADNWSNGQASEGIVLVYRGSASGVLPASASAIELNLTGARLGRAVAEAGDINGDGYADLVLGMPQLTSGQTNEGRIYVYPGSSAGLSGVPQFIESNLTDALSGSSVAGGGDVDGDGYSDIIVGAPGAISAFTNEGAVFAYHGNQDRGLNRLSRQYQTDLVSPLSTNSVDFDDYDRFGIGHRARSPIQRTMAKLHWEVVHEGQPYSGNPITFSMASTGSGAAWTMLPLAGTEIKELILKAPGYVRYKWRVRVEYRQNKLIDGQRFSRWFYGYASGIGDIGILPVELVEFTGEAAKEGNVLHWTTATEQNTARFVIERMVSEDRYVSVGTVDAAGNSQSVRSYRFMDPITAPGTNVYRLRIEDMNGEQGYSPSVAITRNTNDVAIWPNPVSDIMTWSDPEGSAVEVHVLDVHGRLVLSADARSAQLAGPGLAALAPGTYTFLLIDAQGGIVGKARFVK